MWLWEALFNLLFPERPHCPLCGNTAAAGICASCRAVLAAFRARGFCARCGRYPARGEAPPGFVCPTCRRREWPFVAARAAGPYGELLREAVHRLKYRGRRRLAVVLGQLMAEAARGDPLYHHVELCVPVPLAGARLAARGYNQAELLAREVGRRLGLEVVPALAKVRETPPQTGLGRAARAANLEGTLVPVRPAPIRGRRVLLIVDVFTPGA
ncbi:MAG: double zinc ribbon domain-containing protein, partial [Bacillota bacterium]